MKTTALTLTLSTLIFCLGLSLRAQNDSIQTSYFTKGLIDSILNQEGCTGLRMYPASSPNNGESSVMIIGINANGEELYSPEWDYTKYHVFGGLGGNTVNDIAMDLTNAKAACTAYAAANAPFLSDVTSDAIYNVLTRRKDGIAVKHNTDTGNNFIVWDYKESSSGPDIGRQSTYGDPCPSACGESDLYLCAPN